MSLPLSASPDMFRATPTPGRRRNNPSRLLDQLELDAGGPIDLEGVRLFQRSSLAPSSRRAMSAGWQAFSKWCAARNYQSMPAEPLVVASYLTYAANIIRADGEWAYSPTTLSVWLSAINKAHYLAGETEPGAHQEVQMTISGIRREHHRPVSRRAPLMVEHLHRIVPNIEVSTRPRGVIGQRDCAILLLGFSGAFRRSELASLELRDLSIHKDGLYVRLRRSKTDQEGKGQMKAVPIGADPMTCAPCAVARWIRLLAATEAGADGFEYIASETRTAHVCGADLPAIAPGPLFRPVFKNGTVKNRAITGDVVHNMLKRRVKAAGYDERQFGGHSLRAGFVTEAFGAGATHHEIMRQTGHKSTQSVENYSREHNPLSNNAIVKIAL